MKMSAPSNDQFRLSKWIRVPSIDSLPKNGITQAKKMSELSVSADLRISIMGILINVVLKASYVTGASNLS